MKKKAVKMTSKKLKVEAEDEEEQRMDAKSGSDESSDEENDEAYEGDEVSCGHTDAAAWYRSSWVAVG